MKKMVIVLFTLSICLASGNIKKQMDDLMRSLQYKYQISGPEDLYKLKTQQTPQHGRTASRDMEDLVGDWMMEEENMELFVTVGSDQSIPDPFSTMGLVEADGSVTATTNDFETDLNYLMMGLFGDDGPDCNMNCEGEYDDYMSYGYDVSDDYCECCHEDYPIDEICEDDDYDNILPNGDFEDVYEAGNGWQFYATDWIWYPTYAVNHHVELTGNYIYGTYIPFEAFDGDYSLKLWGQFSGAENQTAYYQTFTDLEPGTEIHAEAMLMSHQDHWIGNGSNTVTVFASYWDAGWGFIGRDDSEVFSGADEYNMWHERGVDAVVPEGVSYVNIGLEFSQIDDSQGGSVYIDNMNVHIYDDDEDDDWSPEAVITNMNLMEFFMLMFGFDPDSLGVENPVVVGSSSTQTESGDIVLDEVFAMLFSGGEMLELEADSGEAVTLTSIDTVTGSATFDNLILYDSTGAAGLTLSGAIGPGMMDFVAGEETVFPFLEGMEDMFGDGEDDYEAYMLFYEDSTGMEIEVEYYDDEYYYDYPEIHIDTSYFSWSATSDSLFLYEESEYYYDELDTTELAYFISSTDTLNMGASFDPCEDEDSFEECLEFASEEIAGLDELEDIQSLRISMGRVLTPGSYTAVDAGNGSLPQEFNLYANYPNPFNPVTTIRFDVGMNSGNNTILRIYDITGRNVATLINGQLQTGTYEVRWDARGFSSGIYFSELISGTKRHTQKMVLLK